MLPWGNKKNLNFPAIVRKTWGQGLWRELLVHYLPTGLAGASYGKFYFWEKYGKIMDGILCLKS